MNVSKFNQQLRNAVDTGKVIYGTKKTIKEALIGEPKIIIVSNNIENIKKKQLEYYSKLLDIKFIEYPENGFELGSVCGKPFNISALTVKDLGEADIDEAFKKETETKENSRVKAKREKKQKKQEQKQKKQETQEKVKNEYVDKKKQEQEQKEDKLLKDIVKIKKK